MLLATLAAWLTTVPPTPTIYDYNALAPYICLLASFGMILGSVIVGSTVLYSTPMITGTWYHKVGPYIPMNPVLILTLCIDALGESSLGLWNTDYDHVSNSFSSCGD